jgi:hypothetical protein
VDGVVAAAQGNQQADGGGPVQQRDGVVAGELRAIDQHISSYITCARLGSAA